MKKIISCILAATLMQCDSKEPSQQQNAVHYIAERNKTDTTRNNIKISSKLIPALNNTWGYDVFAENKLIIHQPAIPACAGNEGFKSKIAAQKVAELVISKIKKGEMPPTVTVEELKKLNAI